MSCQSSERLGYRCQSDRDLKQMSALQRVWGIKKRVPEPEVKVPVLEVKAAEPRQEDLEPVNVMLDTTQRNMMKQHATVKSQRKASGAPWWLVITLGVACFIFLMLAASTAFQMREAYAAHSRILEKLVTLAAPAVQQSQSTELDAILAQLRM